MSNPSFQSQQTESSFPAIPDDPSILQVLKGAKKYLAVTGSCEDKALFICYAIGNYLNDTYNDTVGVDKYTAYIGGKIKEVNEYAATFPSELGIKYIPNFVEIFNLSDINRIDYLDARQKARHLWLDDLIAELEELELTNTDTE